MSDVVRVAVLGAGGRGTGFGRIIGRMPDRAKVVAVAEPRAEYREAFAREHDLPPDRVFERWQEFVQQPRMCDAVIVSTMDREHVEPAVASMEMGYHLLLEKPMATTLEDCRRITAAQRASGVITGVVHSLRYHKAFAQLKSLVDEGAIGRLITMDQLEPVAWWHQAHSFVRGNWGNQERSTFMLLAKSCHDLDYIAYLAGTPCRRVSSYGALSYFTPANAPKGSGQRCTDCAVEPDCPYSAFRHYVYTDRTRWPAASVSHDHSIEAHIRAIEEGPYGRCVWKCDNDVVDHQVVAMEFEGEITCTFTMTAFSQEGGRRIRLHGTEGEVLFREDEITLWSFADGNTRTIRIGPEPGGHGGGDERVVRSFVRAIREERPELVLTDVHESLRTHEIVFAAERSRLEARAVELPLA